MESALQKGPFLRLFTAGSTGIAHCLSFAQDSSNHEERNPHKGNLYHKEHPCPAPYTLSHAFSSEPRSRRGTALTLEELRLAENEAGGGPSSELRKVQRQVGWRKDEFISKSDALDAESGL